MKLVCKEREDAEIWALPEQKEKVREMKQNAVSERVCYDF